MIYGTLNNVCDRKVEAGPYPRCPRHAHHDGDSSGLTSFVLTL